MSSGWSWPLTRLVCTDEYGMRFHPIYHTMRLHRGIDLAASKNDRVYCTAEGRVSHSGYNGGEGNSVHVIHPDGTKTKYFHNTSLVVSEGDVVHEGTLLAFAGTTGDSTGVHVHFETHDNAYSDSPVNPRDFMAFRGAPFGSAPASGGNATPATPAKSPYELELEYLMSVADDIVNDLKARIIESENRQLSVIRDGFAAIMRELSNDNAQIDRVVAEVNKSITATQRESRARLYHNTDTGERIAIGGILKDNFERINLGTDDGRSHIDALRRKQLVGDSYEQSQGYPEAQYASLLADANVPRYDLELTPVPSESA